ncbi:MAG TPA: hypothetical protein DDY32_03260, partial [Desulfobulbaceae bacterium]|nr:hypothetical protein [Desulfobulbaceae bacterium]
MDNVEKLRVMLQHWIEHNKGHMEEFTKWQETMAGEGKTSLAAHIAKAIEMMVGMNEELHQALHEAGGHGHDDDHHHHHH